MIYTATGWRHFWRRYIGWLPVQFCMVWGGFPYLSLEKHHGDDVIPLLQRPIVLQWLPAWMDYCSARGQHLMLHRAAKFLRVTAAGGTLAYNDEQAFVFKESDCLAFGPWVERMYSEIGNRGMIFGSNQYACAQSLVLIRHAFIPEFVRLYLGEGSEQLKSNECEWKFKRLEQRWPDLFGRFSFGVDRARPIPYDAEVFYAQQLQADEMAELKSRGLI